MPFNITYNNIYNILLIKYIGEISKNEILNCISSQYNNPSFQNVEYSLVDLTNSKFIFHDNEINQISDHIRCKFNTPQKRIIIVNTPRETAYLTLYKDQLDDSDILIKICSTYELAHSFIKTKMKYEEFIEFMD
jgi:hypothetical protein